MSAPSRYKISTPLGSGTYGKVYLATLTTPLPLPTGEKLPTGTQVAIKTINPVPLNSPPSNDSSSAAAASGVHISAIREVSIMRELSLIPDSPFLPLHDCYTTGPSLNLVLSLCPSDLSKVIAKRPLSVPEIRTLGSAMYGALSTLHSLSVVHRDIKPDNILISEGGRPLLSDFGLSRFAPPPGGQMSPEAVTLWYKPLEMLLGECYYTSSVDVWSLSCVLYECAVGDVLFRSGTGRDVDQIKAVFEKLGSGMEGYKDAELLPARVRGVKWTKGVKGT
eukprot:CAMPEP_0182456450 /NCGR_PEP_ID=MMETSP1319-20130603/2275_1 /TAXON_ID=172717 /ORGANISM="Bolidomonas pacifica, Strain RCC208" /LENGTH=277 /DNA_ID=CAMNT_0024654691 /DNA_START=331 /DNA_END=1160 /DNA_ORIENTATION=+